MRALFVALTILLTPLTTIASIDITVEEIRLYKADDVIPEIINRYDSTVNSFLTDFRSADSFETAKNITQKHSQALWKTATKDLQQTQSTFDDRPLYWARLKMSKAVHLGKSGQSFSRDQINQLVAIIDQVSRGYTDINFKADSDIKILITGFDPFLLDRNIKQSNPSGVAALWLDNKIIEKDGKTIEIQAAMFPVKYQDFDDGIVEKVTEPFLKNNSIDLLATISMGREHFDLEHFPGRRRSASAPGNNNMHSGGSRTNPVIPKLGNKPLQGPEFVEYSLPYETMMQTKGKYKINDRRQVTTLEKTFKPNSLQELEGAIAVEGGGGGYLSNEISYRTVLLGNKLGTKVPTGHIHTPRIKSFDKEVIQEIVEQIQRMLINGGIQVKR
jgi:pyrrolidone-carboxylate peptidase